MSGIKEHYLNEKTPRVGREKCCPLADAKAFYLTEKAAREECYRLAEERGYLPFAALRIGRIILRTKDGFGEEVDYVRDILAPRGLVPYDYLVKDWTDAKRLLGMLPPARG